MLLDIVATVQLDGSSIVLLRAISSSKRQPIGAMPSNRHQSETPFRNLSKSADGPVARRFFWALSKSNKKTNKQTNVALGSDLGHVLRRTKEIRGNGSK